MSKLVVTTFVSLDGVMQAPGGPDEDRSGGFDQGGWLAPFADDDMGKNIMELMGQADGFLLGRKTYEIFAAYWPHLTDPGDPIAHALNTLPKFVASTTLTKVDWNNSRLIQGRVSEEVAKLKRQPGRQLQVHGSSGLIQTLIESDLVDEYWIWSFPVVLGRGKRLFEAGAVPTALRLVGHKTTGSGVAIHTYQRDGEMRHGNAGDVEWREKLQRSN